jgi:outer membrane immunogenic protein
MKRLLLTSAAAVALVAYGTSLHAADMAVKAPPPPYIPPQFNWTGFYVGGNVGGGAATGTVFDSIGASLGSVGGQASFIGGGQIGYNWQFSPNLVFGVDWFFDGISNNNGGSITFVSPVTGHLDTATASADWVTTITGRLGFTGPQADHWMFYTKGGGGWLQTQASFTDSALPATVGNTKTTGGWVWGAGVEWAFAQNWTARLEYQYLGLNNIGVGNILLHDSFSIQNANFQSVTLGINYLFNWGGPAYPGPVVSRY